MSQYRSKCFFASLTGHLVLLVLLLVSPAFMRPQEQAKPDLPPIDYVPDRLVDQALYTPPPPEPQPEVIEPPPEKTVTPEIKEPPPEPPKEEQPKPKPAPKEPEKPKWQPNKNIQVSAKKAAPAKKTPAKQTDPTRRIEQQKQIDQTIDRLRRGLSSRTEISSSSDLAYAQEVLRRYREAWVPPSGNDVTEGMVQIEVVIRRDGTVVQSRIIQPSGQVALDASVRRALDRVKKIAPFPAGARENERTYKIKLYLETN